MPSEAVGGLDIDQCKLVLERNGIVCIELQTFRMLPCILVRGIAFAGIVGRKASHDVTSPRELTGSVSFALLETIEIEWQHCRRAGAGAKCGLSRRARR
jgi:hypothetical protein